MHTSCELEEGHGAAADLIDSVRFRSMLAVPGANGQV
jgi:hypothetical protein